LTWYNGSPPTQHTTMSVVNSSLVAMGQRAQQHLVNSRDLSPTTAAALTAVGVTTAFLSDADIADRVETNLMYWRVVCLVASRAVTAPVKIDFLAEAPNAEDIEAMSQILSAWRQQFYVAQSTAEAYGEAFLAISTAREDGAKTVHNILRPNTVGSIKLEPVPHRLTREGEYYYWPNNPLERSRRRVHESRILHFVNRAKAGVVPPEGASSYKSFIHRFAFALNLYTAGLSTALTKMAQKEAIVATKKGLDSDVAVADEPEQYVKDTLAALVKSLTENGIALLDGKFDVSMIARSLTGMPEVTADLRANVVANSGLTDSLLFNDTTKAHAVAGSEDPDELFLAKAVDYLMQTSWCPKFTRLFALLKGAPQLVVRMQSSYALSATALAKIKLDLAREAAILMTYQVNTPGEVRSRDEGEWTPYMQLDPSYVPPRMPIKVKAPKAQPGLNKSNVQPSDRGAIDPAVEGLGGNKSKRVGDESVFMRLLAADYPEVLAAIEAALPKAADRMRDEELGEFITDFGKSQPRLLTLRKIEERAIADDEDPDTRITEFCDVWRDGDGDTDDIDLLPPSKRPSFGSVEHVSDGSWLVWFGGRRTPIGVSAASRSEAISKARKKKKRGGEKVVSARQATAAEKKTAAGGGWIRTGPKGEPAGRSKLRGYGPKPG
jgi:hypothetical protein